MIKYLLLAILTGCVQEEQYFYGYCKENRDEAYSSINQRTGEICKALGASRFYVRDITLYNCLTEKGKAGWQFKGYAACYKD